LNLGLAECAFIRVAAPTVGNCAPPACIRKSLANQAEAIALDIGSFVLVAREATIIVTMRIEGS